MQVNFLLPGVNPGGISVVNPRRVRREIPSDRVERFIQPFIASGFLPLSNQLGQSDGLPASLLYARNFALVSEVTEANTADSALTEICVGTTTDLASVVAAGGELGLCLLLQNH